MIEILMLDSLIMLIISGGTKQTISGIYAIYVEFPALWVYIYIGIIYIYILILKHVFNKKNQTRGYNYTYMMSYIKSTLAS